MFRTFPPLGIESARLRGVALRLILLTSLGTSTICQATPPPLRLYRNSASSHATQTIPNSIAVSPTLAQPVSTSPVSPTSSPPAGFSGEYAAASLATNSTLVSGSKGSVTISVSSIRPGGGYVQVGCDSPAVILSPSSSWPYNLLFPDGGSYTQQMTITAVTVSQPTTVTIYACEEGVDITNPANWRVTTTVTVTPPTTAYVPSATRLQLVSARADTSSHSVTPLIGEPNTTRRLTSPRASAGHVFAAAREHLGGTWAIRFASVSGREHGHALRPLTRA